MSNNKPKILVIVGPTSSGKSDLAVELAKKFNGEVVSADSRQVYRGMDIGTGKITKKEMQGVVHHLLDVASPRKQFSVAQYKKLAQTAIKKILKKGKLPIICGGTGFYIQAVVDNLEIPKVKPDLKLRAKLEKMTADELYKILKKLDLNRAKNIDRYNKRRLIRAIEIVKVTGRPVPRLKGDQPYDALFIGIKKTRRELASLIYKRLEKRFKQGMVKEVLELKQSGLSWKKLENFGLEYRWIARFLQKKISADEMIEKLYQDIKNYAKRQMTWFSAKGGSQPKADQPLADAKRSGGKRDKRINWIEDYKQVEKLVKEFFE